MPLLTEKAMVATNREADQNRNGSVRPWRCITSLGDEWSLGRQKQNRGRWLRHLCCPNHQQYSSGQHDQLEMYGAGSEHDFIPWKIICSCSGCPVI